MIRRDRSITRTRAQSKSKATTRALARELDRYYAMEPAALRRYVEEGIHARDSELAAPSDDLEGTDLDENVDLTWEDEDTRPSDEKVAQDWGAWPGLEERRPWPEPRAYDPECSYTLVIFFEGDSPRCVFQAPVWFDDQSQDPVFEEWKRTMRSTYNAMAEWFTRECPAFLERPGIGKLLAPNTSWEQFKRFHIENHRALPIVTQKGLLQHVHPPKMSSSFDNAKLSKNARHVWFRWLDKAMPLDMLFTHDAKCAWLAAACCLQSQGDEEPWLALIRDRKALPRASRKAAGIPVTRLDILNALSIKLGLKQQAYDALENGLHLLRMESGNGR